MYKYYMWQISKTPGVLDAWRKDGESEEEKLSQWRSSLEEVHEHPRCSNRWKILKGEEEQTLMLMIYSDDVRHAGGGTRATKDHNVCHAYVTVMNSPGPALRKIGAHWTHHLSYTADYAKEEEERQWGAAVADLQELVDDGIVLADTSWWAVKLFILCGDQMELNKRAGLLYAFSGTYVDRYSYFKKAVRLEATSVHDLKQGIIELRTPESQEEEYRLLQDGSATRGTERSPILNTVNSYNVFDEGSTAPCTAHDLYVGIFKKDLGMIILLWTLTRRTTLAKVSESINKFKLLLRGKDERNFLGKCNLKKVAGDISIPGNMIQARNLVRYFPLIMRHLLKEDNTLANDCTWKLLIIMNKIQRGYQSFAISESQRINLGHYYEEYLDEKLNVDKAVNNLIGEEGAATNTLICKHVTVLHYPSLVKHIGSLAHYSTLVQAGNKLSL